MTKIAISAAETSGELIASKLITALKQYDPDVVIEGLAGEKMLESGCKQLWDQKLVNVMGFTEVLKKLPGILKLKAQIIEYFSNNKPDVFIGVDSPDFNFPIEKTLKAKGIKTIHFVSPSIWAWRQNRVKKIKHSTDLVLCLFPFEVDFYKQHNQNAVFVGHPLADKLTPRGKHEASNKVVLMPGSRVSEIKAILPEMLRSAQILAREKPELEFHLPLADSEIEEWVNSQIDSNINVSIGDAHEKIKQADLVIVASGTASLEVALIGVPMIVVYKLSNISYFIASRLIKSKYISLPNVIANKELIPELIQDNANAENIAKHANNILSRDNSELVKEFAAIHKALSMDSAHRAAKEVYKFINE